MITSLKDDEGKIIALCEWRLVGPSGYEVPNAEYVFISELWIHEKYRFKNLISLIIEKIMKKAPQAKYGYFEKEKGKSLRVFKRNQFYRRSKSLLSEEH